MPNHLPLFAGLVAFRLKSVPFFILSHEYGLSLPVLCVCVAPVLFRRRNLQMQLKVPVNFVLPEQDIWPEMANGQWREIDDDCLSQRCTTPVTYWINHAYIQFKRAGFPVTYSSTLKEDVVNIAEGTHIGLKTRPFRAFLVSTRGDGHRPCLGNFAIEQNGLRGSRPNMAVITGFPQPGILPRDPSRGSRLEVLAFKGSSINLASVYKSEDFIRSLSALGVRLRLDTLDARKGADREDSGAHPRIKMHDYQDVDAVLAVRDLTQLDYMTKPPNKVFNSWIAGVPALVGPEPAYAEIRRSDLDFLVVRSPKDVLRVLKMLKSNPDLYAKIIEQGHRRAPEYSVPAILRRWVDVLNGPIREQFETWSSTPTAAKRGRWVYSAVMEKVAKKSAAYWRRRGERGPGTAAIPSC